MSELSSSARRDVGSLVAYAVGSMAIQTAASMFQDSVGLWVATLGTTLLAGAVWLTMGGGPLRRRSEGVSPERSSAGVIMLALSVGGSAYASQYWAVLSAAMATAILMVAATILIWPILQRGTTPSDAILGVAFLLVGATFLLGAVAFLLGAVAFLLGAVAFLLLGVAFLLVGAAFLLGGVSYVFDYRSVR